ADRAHRATGDRDAIRIEDLTRVAPGEQSLEPVAVLREQPVVAVVEPSHRVEGGRVDRVHRPANRRKASSEEDLTETVGGDAEVVQRAEAPERLTEHTPPFDTEVLAEAF